jgi:hypothetical protein
MAWKVMHLARIVKDPGGVPAHGDQRFGWDAGCTRSRETEHR